MGQRSDGTKYKSNHHITNIPGTNNDLIKLFNQSTCPQLSCWTPELAPNPKTIAIIGVIKNGPSKAYWGKCGISNPSQSNMKEPITTAATIEILKRIAKPTPSLSAPISVFLEWK